MKRYPGGFQSSLFTNELYRRYAALASFTDPDSRVRYYACEALYNIAKVARGGFIAFFNDVVGRFTSSVQFTRSLKAPGDPTLGPIK
jgi:hypothetical protein